MGFGLGLSVGPRRNPGQRTEGGIGTPGPVSTAPVQDGLILDLDADVATDVTIVDGKVSEWRDRSTQLNHATQATASQRPVYISSDPDFNGHASLQGDQSQNVNLSTGAFNGGTEAQPNTFFIVCTWDNRAPDAYIVDAISSGTREAIGERTDGPGIFAGTWVQGDAGAVADQNKTLVFTVFDGPSTEARFEPDGGDVVNLADDAGAAGLPGVTVLGGFDANNGWNGKVTRVLVYNRRLTLDETQDMLRYLRGLYDVTTLDKIGGLIADYDPEFFTESGGNVTVAPDSSSNGNDLTVNGTVPYLAADPDFNNRASIEGGAGYLIRSDYVQGILNQPNTVYFVCQTPAAVAATQAMSTRGLDLAIQVNAQTDNTWGLNCGVTLSTPEPFALESTGLLTTRQQGATSELIWEADGTYPVQATGDAGTNAIRGITLLARSNGAGQYLGKVARVLVFNRLLGPTEDEVVRRYLKSKYGIEYTVEDIIASAIADYDADNFTEAGGNVDTAPDSSGNGNDLTVNGTVPYTASDPEFNGHASIAGPTGSLARATFTGGAISQPFSIYLVAKYPGGATTEVAVDSGADTDRCAIRQRGGDAGMLSGSAGDYTATSGLSTGTKFVWSGHVLESGSGVDFLVEADGEPPITYSAGVGSTQGMNGVTLLANYLLGANWTQSLARVLIFNRRLSQTEDEAVRQSLRAEYGIEYTVEDIIASAIADYNADDFTEAGGNVATAPDSSGNGNDLTVTGTIPYLASDPDFNGRPSIQGGTGYLRRTAWTQGTQGQPNTVYVVTTRDPDVNKFLQDGVGASNRLFMFHPSGNNRPSIQTTGSATVTVGQAQVGPAIWSARYDGADSLLRIDEDGLPPQSASGDMGTTAWDGINLLADRAEGRLWAGKVARVLVFSRALSADEDTRLREHLKSLYGITPA